ncbi:MAG: hypothetical protein M1353_00630 [Nitrospirae bacterium]|nr:hypothetical protein [Nitrospirota bacterium]
MSEYPNVYVAMEGVLELEEVDYKPMISCPDGRCQNLKPCLIGWAKRENGATSLHYLLDTLKFLNGKKVKISIEWEEAASCTAP